MVADRPVGGEEAAIDAQQKESYIAQSPQKSQVIIYLGVYYC